MLSCTCLYHHFHFFRCTILHNPHPVSCTIAHSTLFSFLTLNAYLTSSLFKRILDLIPILCISLRRRIYPCSICLLVLEYPAFSVFPHTPSRCLYHTDWQFQSCVIPGTHVFFTGWRCAKIYFRYFIIY